MTKLELPSFNRELEAARRLKASMQEAYQDDSEFLTALLEGETNLFELLDVLLDADMHDAAMLSGIEAAANALDARRKRIADRAARRRVMISEALLIAEAKSLQRPIATVTMANRQPKLVIDDEATLPKKFMKKEIKLKPDKKAIEEAIKSGVDVPGAHIDNGAPTLSIRRK